MFQRLRGLEELSSLQSELRLCPDHCAAWLSGDSDRPPDHVCLHAAEWSVHDYAECALRFVDHIAILNNLTGGIVLRLIRDITSSDPLSDLTLGRVCELMQRIVPEHDAWRTWADSWPLPVSRTAFAHWYSSRCTQRFGPDAAHWPPPSVPPLPLATDDDVWAGLAARRTTEAGQIWLLGLVMRTDNAPMSTRLQAHSFFFGQAWRWADPVLLTEACAHTAAALDALHAQGKRLLKWYMRTLYGQAVTGRPEGSTAMTDDEFESRYREVYQRWCTERSDRPTIADIAAELGLSTRAMHYYLQRLRLPWPPEP